MGTVYEAIDLRLNNQVALKEMISNGSARAIEAFEREAQLLANLDHPNLPKVTDHFSENDGHFLVMQFIKGLDLQDWLDLRSRPFPQAQVLDWADIVLGVIEYLHKHVPPILHRDIKPSNIKRSELGRIFLLDFGLAKGAAGQMATHSNEQSLIGGTRPYESLEQLLGQRTAPDSDLYSLGATLYHLISGNTPIDAATRFHTVIEDEEPDPLQLGDEFTPQVKSVIYHAMAINRRDRLSSAAEMRRELRNAAEEDQRSMIEADYRLAEERSREREAKLPREQFLQPLTSTLIFDAQPAEQAVQIQPAKTDQLPLANNPAHNVPSPILAAEAGSSEPADKPIHEQPQERVTSNAAKVKPVDGAGVLLQQRKSIRDFFTGRLLVTMVALLAFSVYLSISLSNLKQSNSNQSLAGPTPNPSSQPSAAEPPPPSLETKEELSFNSKVTSDAAFTLDVSVNADNTHNGWTNTGLVVQTGQNLLITASGQVDLGNNSTGPGGSPVSPTNAGDRLITSQPIGGLVAVIGDDNDDFIFIGAAKHIVAWRSGVLFLGVNEESPSDNSGSFKAVIKAEKLRRTPDPGPLPTPSSSKTKTSPTPRPKSTPTPTPKSGSGRRSNVRPKRS